MRGGGEIDQLRHEVIERCFLDKKNSNFAQKRQDLLPLMLLDFVFFCSLLVCFCFTSPSRVTSRKCESCVVVTIEREPKIFSELTTSVVVTFDMNYVTHVSRNTRHVVYKDLIIFGK